MAGILEHHEAAYEQVIKAAGDGRLCLVLMVDHTSGERVPTLCISSGDGLLPSSTIPIAVMLEQDKASNLVSPLTEINLN